MIMMMMMKDNDGYNDDDGGDDDDDDIVTKDGYGMTIKGEDFYRNNQINDFWHHLV